MPQSARAPRAATAWRSGRAFWRVTRYHCPVYSGLEAHRRYLAAVRDACSRHQIVHSHQIVALDREIALVATAGDIASYRAASGDMFEPIRAAWLDRAANHARVAVAVDDSSSAEAAAIEYARAAEAAGHSDWGDCLAAGAALAAPLRARSGDIRSGFTRLVLGLLRMQGEGHPDLKTEFRATAMSSYQTLRSADPGFTWSSVSSRPCYFWRVPWTGSGRDAVGHWLADLVDESAGGIETVAAGDPLAAITAAQDRWQSQLVNRAPAAASANEPTASDIVAPYRELMESQPGDDRVMAAIRRAAGFPSTMRRAIWTTDPKYLSLFSPSPLPQCRPSRRIATRVALWAQAAGRCRLAWLPRITCPPWSRMGATVVGGGLHGALNGVATAYSANLLGAQQTINGTSFFFGPANAPDAVSGKTVLLPAGQFSTLNLLATAVNGSHASQNFTVTYTDGTTTSFMQSLSDWFAPQNFASESKAVPMAYRDTGNGVRDNRTVLLYGYSFNLNGGKNVSSIALPNNRNVVVLAISLSRSATLSSAAVPVNLSPAFDITGISSDGKAFTGGLDGAGFAYSANLLGATRTFDNTPFIIGRADAPDAVSGNGKTIGLPAGKFSALQMLATGVNGSPAAQTFKVTYSDGTSSTFAQSLSDWFRPQNFPGESRAAAMSRRNSSGGTPENGPFYLYGYSFSLDNSKTVRGITMPNNGNVKVFALTLVP